MTFKHPIQRKENLPSFQHPFNRTAIHSTATTPVARPMETVRLSSFQRDLTALPVLQLKCDCEEKETPRKKVADQGLIQMKGKNALKQAQAQARRQKKDAQKGQTGQGVGHAAAATGAQLTCYKNAGCGGERRTFASAHNCCNKFGKSYRHGNSQCVSCTQQTTVTAKH
jgi:hypothetical protein